MIHFGREITSSLDTMLHREWLVTNGIGGYAMGSLAGARTRRYHSLLTASLQPPTRRTLTIASLDAWVDLDGRRSPLVTHEWAAGVVLPDGYRHLESFRLEGAIPVFVWGLGDVRIVQRIWMAHGQNTTYVTYTYARGTANVRMVLKPLCTYRDHHALTKGGYHVDVEPYAAPWPDGQAVKVQPLLDRHADPARPFRIYSSGGTITPDGEWWWSFHLAEEKKRGLDNQEDLFAAATISADLRLGNTLAVVFTAEDDHPVPWHDALQAEQQRQHTLLEQAELPPHTPEWIQQLVLAADQFVVSRNIEGEPGKSLLAGYPWFSDWGRDTMIALPGLTLATGRREEAAAILQTYAKYVDQGMLPNRFPDAGQAPEYNTVDATLWYFQSVYACYKACGRDHPAIKELYPVLIAILKWHISGTRFNIRMDPADGLLHAGELGLQLTWMDAKIDDWVVTPRVGKPVEINALWVNALRIAAELAAELGYGEDAQTYHDMAERAHASFQARFWYSGGYLYDVIDGPEGDDDPTLRPNQIFAVSLPFPLLEGEQAKAVVDICARELVVSHGQRSLAPDETDYVGYYGGDRLQRDGAYHQGTVWSWLIGPFVSAHYRVYGNARTAMTYLEPMADHLYDHGLGTISEIYDGDPPHVPHGCIAQAWGVAEVLRVWRVLQG
jgi:predicted glycogen debranching enzyme